MEDLQRAEKIQEMIASQDNIEEYCVGELFLLEKDDIKLFPGLDISVNDNSNTVSEKSTSLLKLPLWNSKLVVALDRLKNLRPEGEILQLDIDIYLREMEASWNNFVLTTNKSVKEEAVKQLREKITGEKTIQEQEHKEDPYDNIRTILKCVKVIKDTAELSVIPEVDKKTLKEGASKKVEDLITQFRQEKGAAIHKAEDFVKKTGLNELYSEKETKQIQNSLAEIFDLSGKISNKDLSYRIKEFVKDLIPFLFGESDHVKLKNNKSKLNAHIADIKPPSLTRSNLSNGSLGKY